MGPLARARAPFAIAVLALLAAAPGGAARAEDVEVAYAQSPLERDVARMLHGRSESASFVFHVRPGSRAEKEREAIARELEERWARLAERLGTKPRAKVHVYLYDGSQELARITGRAGGDALAIGNSVHLPVDRAASRTAALARVLEGHYGRAGGKVGSVEGGQRYKLRVVSKGNQLEASLDDKPLARLQAATQAGGIRFGVEGGRITLSDVKIRESATDMFALPFRAGEGAIVPDLDGRWRLAGDTLEGVRYSRWARATLAGANVRDFELECTFALSDGASAEFAFHVGPDRSNRLFFMPGTITWATYADGKFVSSTRATGPSMALRTGLAEALAAEIEGRAVHPLARVLVEGGSVQPLDRMLKMAVPAEGTAKTQTEILLASFVAFCLERHGVASYRDLHFYDLGAGKTPLGEIADLESAWKSFLRTDRRASEGAADAARALGTDVLAQTAAWRDLTPAMKERKFKTSGGGAFAVGRDGLSWEGQPAVPPGRASPPETAPARGAIRATVRFSEGSRARIGILSREGKAALGLLSESGASILTPDNTVAAKSDFPLDADRWYDAAFVYEGGAARLYLDGRLVAEAASGIASGPGTWSIECGGRKVEVQSVGVRGLE